MKQTSNITLEVNNNTALLLPKVKCIKKSSLIFTSGVQGVGSVIPGMS